MFWKYLYHAGVQLLIAVLPNFVWILQKAGRIFPLHEEEKTGICIGLLLHQIIATIIAEILYPEKTCTSFHYAIKPVYINYEHMAGESSITKINAIIGTVVGLTALLTWFTGLSGAPELIFGREAREVLPKSLQEEITEKQQAELTALQKEVSQLGNKMPDSITTYIDSNLNREINEKYCHLAGKIYTGARTNESIQFMAYDTTSYLIELGLYLDDAKGVITQTAPGEYKVISGNLTGIITVSPDCKTVIGRVKLNGESKEFTYYNLNH